MVERYSSSSDLRANDLLVEGRFKFIKSQWKDLNIVLFVHMS